eukprot:1375681-Amorphochlora_amoeboformis.AAC.2
MMYRIPEAWATPAAASTDPAASSSSTDKETTSIFATVNKAQADTSKKDEKAVKVENSPFVALYQPGGLLAWPGAGTSAVNGLGNLPSAIPTLPLPQFPALSQTNGANNIAQAMRMLNSYQTGAAAMMRFVWRSDEEIQSYSSCLRGVPQAYLGNFRPSPLVIQIDHVQGVHGLERLICARIGLTKRKGARIL